MSPPAQPVGRTELARIALVFAAVIAGGCDQRSTVFKSTSGVAPSAAPEGPATASRIHVQGELGQAPDFAMSLDGVKECPLGTGNALRLDFEKIGVEVDLEATMDRQIPANPFYATLTDPAGERYPATLAGCEPALPSVVLGHGEKAHGFITFAVPRLARKLELRYAPPVVGRPPEELRFTVAR